MSQFLICAYLFDGRGAATPLEAEALSSWNPRDGVRWVHLDTESPASLEWLLKKTDLDPTIAEALVAGDTRPRSVSDEDGLLIVLRGVNTNPGADPEDMVAIRLWIDARQVISSRRRQLLSVQDIRDALEAGTGPRSSGEFLIMLVERLAERIGNVVDGIDDDLDRIELDREEVSLAASSELGSLRRQTAAIRRYLAPQRDALDRLYRNPGGFLSEAQANELREQADRITRYLEDLDLARERSMVLREEYFTRLAHDQNSRMYLLSVVAALFLPLTFVTGLFGMNVAGLPGTENVNGFLFSVLAMSVLAAALLVVFRLKRWL
ncbi:MAG TPA: zinc transporter ZntB [Gammaproteobacteria bacterium]